MKKPKKKIGYVIGCVALSIMLAISSYISLVIIGVFADEKKNGNIIQNNTVTDATGVDTDNVAVENDGYITDNGNILPSVSISDTGTVTGTVTDNAKPGGGGSQNIQTPSGSISTQQNKYLNTAKTAADIVEIYATVMNKAKSDKPGFTKIEYQELPGDPANRVISEGDEHVSQESINKLFGFIEDLGVFVPKEKAESEPYIHEKGDEDMSLFPVFSREKGSYLTDPKGIESFTYKVLANGNVKMSFILVPEDNPEPIAENSNVAPSYTGAVFSPMSKERIDGTVYHPIVTVFAKNIQYSLRYHDCYVEVEFNPNTLQIVNLKQLANVSIKGSGDVVGAGTIGVERQELYSTVIIKDIKY